MSSAGLSIAELWRRMLAWRLPSLFRSLGFLVVYVALEWLSSIHEFKGLAITPWNPGLGVLFALMVRSGAGYAILLFLGVLIAELAVLRTSLDTGLVLGVAAIVALGYGLAAMVLRRFVRIDFSLAALRDLIWLLGVGIAAAFVTAVLLSLTVLADADIGQAEAMAAFAPFFVGDAIGIAVATPLYLRFNGKLRQPLWRPSLRNLVEWTILAVAIAAGLGGILSGDSERAAQMIFLLLLPVVFSAARHGLDGACLSLAVVQLGLIGVLQALGYNAEAFTRIQALMLVLTATGLIIGVVVSEREALNTLARQTTARLMAKEAEAAQAARFSLAGGLASALAHEINQPMTAARALARAAQLMVREGGDIARVEQNLARLIGQIDHASSIVRRMREFLRRGRPHVSTIDVKAMLDNVIELIGATAREAGVSIEINVANALPALFGDRIQLEQVVLNLMRNSIESISSAAAVGHIVVSVSHSDEDARMEFRVRDSGPGVSSEIVSSMFDPLTTTKGDGLGLGLPISASIIAAHGGRIWFASQDRGATEVCFSLPIMPGNSA